MVERANEPRVEVGYGVGKGDEACATGAETARQAMSAIHEQPVSAVLVFASVRYDLQELLQGVYSVVGEAPILGTTTAGEICDGPQRESVVVAVLTSPCLKVRVGLGEGVSQDWRQAVAQATSAAEIRPFFSRDTRDGDPWPALARQGKAAFALLFSPGSTHHADSHSYEIMEELKRLSQDRLPIFGGGSADDWRMEQNCVLLGRRAYPDSMLVAVFETQLRFGMGLAHGFRPGSRQTTVTRVEGHEVLELDGRPAAEVYARMVGLSPEELAGKHLTLTTGRPVGGPDPHGQYSVNVASYFTSRGGIRFTHPTPEGTVLTLMKADEDRMVAAGREAVRKAMLRGGITDPAVAFVFSCALRTDALGERAGEEISYVKEMAPGVPVVGFYGFGEQGLTDGGANRHSNAAVTALVLGRELSYAAEVARENERLREALRASEEKYRNVVERANDGIAIIQDARFEYVNPRLAEITGYTAEELIGTSFTHYVHPAELPKLADRYERRMAGEDVPSVYETVLQRKDGSEMYAELNAGLITYQGRPADLVIIRDVTERKQATEEIRRRTAQLEALREVELELTAQLDLDTLLNSIVARAIELLGGTAGGMYLYDPERDVLKWAIAVGPHMASPGTVLHRGEGLSGKIWETGEPLSVDDYRRWEGRAAVYEECQFIAVVGAPVRWGDELLGVLNVNSDTPGAFSPADAELLSLFATPVAIAIRNARLFEEAQRRALEQETLREAALALTTTLDRNEVVERILAQLQQVVPYDTASVQLLRAGHLEIVGGRGFPNLGELLGVTFDPQSRDNPNREVVRTRAPFIVEDAPAVYRGFRRPPHAPAGIRSWLGVPMLVGERLIGMIALDKREPGFYTPEQARLAEAFAAQAAVAIENSRLFQAEREQRELAEALEKAAAAVSGTLDLEVVLDRILEQVARVVAGDAFNIMFIEDDLVRAVRWRGYENLGVEEEIAVFSIPITRYPCFVRMMKTQEPLLVPETTTDPNWVQVEGWEWLRSYVAAPILVRGETVGFLDVDSAQPGKFRSADLRCLRAFADHAAAAIENARLYQETAQRLAQTEVLREMMLAAASTLDFDQVLDRTIEVLERAMGVEYLDFMLPDEDGRFMKSHPSILGFTPPPEGCFRFPTDQCVTGRVFRTGEPVLLTDVREAPDYAVADEKVRSELAVPVKIGTETVAVLNLESRQPAAFDEQDLAFYVAVAGQLGVAMHNARLYQQLHDYAGKLETRVEERTAELQAQYARLDAILRSAADGIVVAGAQGEILQANPVAQRWLTQSLSPEEAGQLREAIRDLATRVEEQPVRVLELTGLDLEMKAAPILEPMMGMVGMTGMMERAAAVVEIHDVSHLKALERMKIRFVTNVSHELRTPITTIKLYVHLMQKHPEKWEQYLAPLAQEVDHQVRLVEDILHISRIDAGRLEMNPLPFPLNELTERVTVSRQALARRQGLTLKHRPAKPGPVALVDPQRTTQVLDNLVGNAIHYTPAGGAVVVSTGVEAAQGRAWATVTISDTGMGIPEDELSFIFDRFFRGERPREMQLSGTGLGLSIVKEIVELHGGWVTVESAEGQGSAFTVWLPLVETRPE